MSAQENRQTDRQTDRPHRQTDRQTDQSTFSPSPRHQVQWVQESDHTLGEVCSAAGLAPSPAWRSASPPTRSAENPSEVRLHLSIWFLSFCPHICTDCYTATVLDIFQTSMETGCTIAVTGQIRGCLYYY